MQTQRVLAVLVILGLAAADVTPAASNAVAYTPQDRVLARSPYGNFACHVNTLQVTTDNPGLQSQLTISPNDIRAAFASVATLEWTHIAQTSFSSMDSRNDEKILATPGGDMGEFIQALHAYATVSGKTLTDSDVQRLFEHYLHVMTRPKFFYETDERAYVKLAVATGCKNLRVADMGGMKHKRDAYLAQLAVPDFIGDPFIRFLVVNATSLNIKVPLVQSALAAFHNVLWTNPALLSTKLCYLEVKGSHQHQALINVRTSDFCVDQGLAPMVSSQLACPAPAMLNYPDAVKVFRRELVSVLTDSDSNVDAREVMAALNSMAEANLNKFWGDVGKDLPVYTVQFLNSSPVLTADEQFVQ